MTENTNADLHGNIKIDFSKKTTKPRAKINRTSHSHKSNTHATSKHSESSAPVGKPGEIPVRVGNLMGLEQVGQCMFVEYDNDLIIVDAGMEFSADETLGVDYIIPDIAYIKKNIKKLRGIVLTHGHLDHIWALRDILPELNYPTLYTTPLTLGLVKKSFEDPREVPKIKFKLVNPELDIIKLGCFTIEFVSVNHNIPESMALAIHTPKGIIFDSWDFKIDHTPAIDKPADLWKVARIGTEWVRLYIGDSLGAGKTGHAVSEKVIGESLENIIKNTKSRLVIATFASNVGRVIQIIQSAIKYNKVIFLSGRSMINNVELCRELGYINVPKNMVRKLDDNVNTLPDDRVVILCTGAQGEEFSALARMARGEHAQVELRKWDTILMSATTIPGNELQVVKMMNDLVIQDINLITNSEMDVHTSWHGGAEDHKLFLTLLKPDYFMPYFTNAAERYQHKKLGLAVGIAEDHVLMPEKNGSIIEMYDDKVVIGKTHLRLNTVMIDGKWKGHLSGEYVVKARKIMAENGMLALIFKIDTKSKLLVGNIQIESRGFVYSSEVKKIHTDIVEFSRKKYEDLLKKMKDVRSVLRYLKDDLTEHVNKIIWREPMILPMFVYINRDGSWEEEIESIEIDESSLIWDTLEEQWIEEEKVHFKNVEESIN